jgi:hypothetical protein
MDFSCNFTFLKLFIMVKSKILITLMAALFISFACSAQGIMDKIKQKAAEATQKAIEKKAKSKTGTQSPQGTNSTSNPGDPANKGGGGLVVTPPDVKQNMFDAEASFKAANYSEARYALKQAMLGVEMEIGQNVLKSLPEAVAGLKKDVEADQVTSMGAGWVGLTIHREYENDDEKQLRVDIANNAGWMSSYNAYMANANYASTGAQQNWKQTKVKGHKGIIEYSDASGYKLSVPLGQSSMIVWEGVNFTSEQDMMNTANAFDIDGIKKTLGEK